MRSWLGTFNPERERRKVSVCISACADVTVLPSISLYINNVSLLLPADLSSWRDQTVEVVSLCLSACLYLPPHKSVTVHFFTTYYILNLRGVIFCIYIGFLCFLTWHMSHVNCVNVSYMYVYFFRLHNAAYPEHPVFSLTLLHVLSAPLHGLANALVFGKDTWSQLSSTGIKVQFTFTGLSHGCQSDGPFL